MMRAQAKTLGAISAILSAILAALLLISPALAQNTAGAEPIPVNFEADEVSHDRDSGIITARGAVTLTQDGRTVQADEISYNQNTDTVIATGTVTLREVSGEVMIATRAELTDGLKNAFVENLRLWLADGSQIEAVSAKRQAGATKTMDQAAFSSCKACPDDPDRPLLWRLRADTVIHDEVAQDIIYRGATMEMFGVPVFYTPYFMHPAPEVERRSGLLAPTMGQSDTLGLIYGQPYFYVIDQSRDLRLEPTWFSRGGLMLKSQYRQAFENGTLDFKVSGGDFKPWPEGDSDQDPKEGHVDIEGRFSVNETWRTGFDVKRASRRTYLRRFHIGTEEILTSQLFLEGFRERNYSRVSVMGFQGLRSGDDTDRQPIVTPAVQYNYVGEPSPNGGRFTFDASATALTRTIGSDSYKLSLLGGWSRPWHGPAGDIYTLSATLQSDLYEARNPTGALTGPEAKARVSETRLFPQIGLNWRYPLVKITPGEGQTSGAAQLIEPIVNIVAGPDSGNSLDIPNEDSQAFEFDETNLFDLNRFSGNDRLTTGVRVDYGVKMGLVDTQFGDSEAFIGQSYHLSGERAFEEGSGLSNDLSDVVARLQMTPVDSLDLLVRSRLDKSNLEPRRVELGFFLNKKPYQLRFDYILLNEQDSTTGFGDREQTDVNLTYDLNENWQTSMRLVQDFSDTENGTRLGAVSLAYSDECFSIGLKYLRNYFRDEDLEPENRISLQVSFKNLGSVGGF